MAHERSRYLSLLLSKDMSRTPSLCLLGMRQTGKTTLLRSLTSSYLTLDDDTLKLRWESGDWANLEALSPPVGLDECQKVPALFDRVKLLADQRKKPGQFILTGSVRFLSKKQIHESLTGRTIIHELLPMNISEAHDEPLSNFLDLAWTLQGEALLAKMQKKARFAPRLLQHILEVGGLPGICFRRDASFRARLFETHLETLLSRDLGMITPTRLPYAQLRGIVRDVFGFTGTPLNKSSVARRAGVSAPTLDRILSGLEALYLVRRHGDTLYPLDLGLGSHVLGEVDIKQRTHAARLVFMELLTQLKYRGEAHFEFGELRSRNGIHVPFWISVPGKPELAIMLDPYPESSERATKGLTWLKKSNPRARGIALHFGDRAYVSSSGHPCVPASWIF